MSLPGSQKKKRSSLPPLVARTAPSKYPIGPQLEEPDDAVAAQHSLSLGM